MTKDEKINNCSISKTKKEYAPNASSTILNETTLTVCGNGLKECEEVFNRVWK